MKTKIFLLLILFLPFSFSHEIKLVEGDTEKPATIKVLLEKEVQGILLEVKGPYAVYNPENGKRESSGKWGKRFYLYPHENGIKWGENFLGIHQLQIVPTSGETTILVNGIQYRGSIEVYNIKNQLNIVNEVDIETYIKIILNEKVEETLPGVILDAIAIIARTDAYYKALINKDAFWHVNKREVGYNGNALTLQHLFLDRAVDHTKYLVMTYKDRPFPAAWTENCAGKTANYSSILRKKVATPKGVISPFAIEKRSDSRWSFTTETQELAKLVKLNRVTKIDLFVDHPSGKVYAIRLHDGTHDEDISFFDLQRKLGKEKLKSNDFNISIKGNIALFEGYGQGHGAGLCLYSALQMIERGDQVPQILSTFFPNATIQKMRAYPKSLLLNRSPSFPSSKKTENIIKKHKILNK